MTENSDPRPLHRRAIAQTGTVLAAVTADQFALPTPCTEYDVRALLSHIIGGLTRAALVGEGDPDALARPAMAEGVPDDGWPAAYRAAADRATAAWADDTKLDTLVTPAQRAEFKMDSRWVVLSRKATDHAQLAVQPGWHVLPPASPVALWTDDFSNVLSVFSWH